MHVGMLAIHDTDHALDLARDLSDMGVRVTLYLSHESLTRTVDDPDHPIERLYESGVIAASAKVRLFHFPRHRDPRSFAVINQIRRAIREDKVDVAHGIIGPDDLWIAMLTNFLRGIPVTSTMIIPQPNVGDPLPGFIAVGVNRLLVRGSDFIIVNGSTQVGQVQKLYGVSASRIAHVPLAPPTTAVYWSRHNTVEEPGTVLFFGRAEPHKGLEYLVKAQPAVTSQVPHARFVIVGRGTELARCRPMIQDGSKFEIHEGFVTGAEMAAYYERASVVAIPYISASHSGVLLTAYGFGKPVVATTVGVLPQYVTEGVTGLTVPPADSEQLAQAIVRILADDTLRRTMNESALRWMAERRGASATQTVVAYEKAISAHNGARRHG